MLVLNQVSCMLLNLIDIKTSETIHGLLILCQAPTASTVSHRQVDKDNTRQKDTDKRRVRPSKAWQDLRNRGERSTRQETHREAETAGTHFFFYVPDKPPNWKKMHNLHSLPVRGQTQLESLKYQGDIVLQ